MKKFVKILKKDNENLSNSYNYISENYNNMTKIELATIIKELLFFISIGDDDEIRELKSIVPENLEIFIEKGI